MKKVNANDLLMDDLKAVKVRLDSARSYYNQVTDPGLISACIYEINSLQAQYSHLLGVAKTTEAVAISAGAYLSRFCR